MFVSTEPAAAHTKLTPPKLTTASTCKIRNCSAREDRVATFTTASASSAPVVTAPDGSEVRVLCQGSRGGMALFTLTPGSVSRAVAHHSVEEIWYFVAGHGQMWRRLGGLEQTVEVGAGTSLTIPIGTRFQFRCNGDQALVAVGVTMPPWPGDGEAYYVAGPWEPTV